jgi:hypothetical protein
MRIPPRYRQGSDASSALCRIRECQFGAKSPKFLPKTKHLTSIFCAILPELAAGGAGPDAVKGRLPVELVGTEKRRAGPFSGGEARLFTTLDRNLDPSYYS